MGSGGASLPESKSAKKPGEPQLHLAKYISQRLDRSWESVWNPPFKYWTDKDVLPAIPIGIAGQLSHAAAAAVLEAALHCAASVP